MGAKKAAAQGEKNGVNKTAFVLGFPGAMKAKEIVDKAKEQGISLSEKHVATIRSKARAKDKPAPAAAKAAAPAQKASPAAKRGRKGRRGPGRPRRAVVAHQAAPVRAAAPRPAASNGASERDFLRLVIDVGLLKASALLDDVRAKLMSLGGAGGGSRPAAAGSPSAPAAPRAAPSGPKKGTGRGRGGRRSSADIGDMVERIVVLLRKHKAGLLAEKLRANLGLSRNAIQRPIAQALADKKISKVGEKRSTTYFAA